MARRNWKDIKAETFSKEQIARIEASTVAEDVALASLAKLRTDLGLTQGDMAESLGLTPGRISQIESAEDPRLGTLRRYVESLGAKLELVAVFPDRTVKLAT